MGFVSFGGNFSQRNNLGSHFKTKCTSHNWQIMLGWEALSVSFRVSLRKGWILGLQVLVMSYKFSHSIFILKRRCPKNPEEKALDVYYGTPPGRNYADWNLWDQLNLFWVHIVCLKGPQRKGLFINIIPLTGRSLFLLKFGRYRSRASFVCL